MQTYFIDKANIHNTNLQLKASPFRAGRNSESRASSFGGVSIVHSYAY